VIVPVLTALRLVVVGAVLALITYWFHRRLVRATGLGRTPARAADIALGTLAVLALAASVTGTVLDPAWARPLGYLGWSWIAVGLYLILGLAVVAIGRGIGWVTRRVRARADIPSDAPVSRRALRVATAAVVVAAVSAVAYGAVAAAHPRIVRTTVPLAALPTGFDGLRVALVTDLHVGPARGAAFVREVVDAVNATKPDLIVLGGDLADGTVAFVGEDLAPLTDLEAPLGVYGVSGNHEYYSDDAANWLDHWESLGVRTLRNEHVVLTRGDDRIALAGVHDYTAPEPDAADVPAALDGIPHDSFVLLAAHQPKHVLEARELGVDLQVSGHTHGGQMWPLGYLVSLANPTVTGLDRFGDTTIYTSFGAGAWGPPVRIAAPPEISVLELTSTGG